MTTDIDIYRVAKQYIDAHGDQAALQAAMQADALLEAGDLDGAATWRKIIKAIEVTQATEPDGVTNGRLIDQFLLSPLRDAVCRY